MIIRSLSFLLADDNGTGDARGLHVADVEVTRGLLLDPLVMAGGLVLLAGAEAFDALNTVSLDVVLIEERDFPAIPPLDLSVIPAPSGKHLDILVQLLDVALLQVFIHIPSRNLQVIRKFVKEGVSVRRLSERHRTC